MFSTSPLLFQSLTPTNSPFPVPKRTKESFQQLPSSLDGSFSWLQPSESEDDDKSSVGVTAADPSTEPPPAKKAKTTNQPEDDDRKEKERRAIIEKNLGSRMAKRFDSLQASCKAEKLCLPNDLMAFLTHNLWYSEYFEMVDSHYLALGTELIPCLWGEEQDSAVDDGSKGFLVHILRCNQDANFFYLYLRPTKSEDKVDVCVVYSTGADLLDQHEKKPTGDEDVLQLSDFEYDAPSVEAFLYQLCQIYQSMA